MKLCGENLSCGHRCQELCHSKLPNNHICRELVEKTVASCQHTIYMECGIEPTSDKCTFMVPARLPCDHISDVTCAIRTSGVFDKVYCPKPCESILLCKHQCSGTCGECKAGQLHVSCKKPCYRQVLCRHVSLI